MRLNINCWPGYARLLGKQNATPKRTDLNISYLRFLLNVNTLLLVKIGQKLHIL
jgi:hypothetical protein